MQYFNFSKKERRGTFALLVLILLFIIVPLFLPFFITQKKEDSKDLETSITKLRLKETDSSTQQNAAEADYPSGELPEKNYAISQKENLFYFDPNTLSTEDWKKLGVRDKTIQTIQKYLSKGGKFYKPDDIKKIWGFRKEETDKLIPYVKIEKLTNIKEYSKGEGDVNEYTHNKKYSKQLIDINIADTTAFIALPGIANKLANRIITFRDKLGGFYSVDQVGETFGLRDSVFQLIKPQLIIGNTPLTQFNINTASIDEMKVHPYIHYAIANAIVQYRTQHGNYSSIADIKKIMLINNDEYNKMAPYLKVTE